MKEFSRSKKVSDPSIMNIEYDPENIELKEMLKLVDISNKKVLDVGCGRGRVTIKIAKKAKEVYAIDVDRESIITARKRVSNLKLKNVKFDIMNSDKINYPNRFFDVVLCPWSLHHIKNKDKTLKQIRRVLKRNGYLVIIEGSSKNDYMYLTNLVKPNAKEKQEERISNIFKTAEKYFKLIKKVHFSTYYMINSKKKTLEMFDFYKVPISKINSDYMNRFLDKRRIDNKYKISESGYIALFRLLA
jgi:ubiquinone/menaquinone biosynthesis C-methylase UbiE